MKKTVSLVLAVTMVLAIALSGCTLFKGEESYGISLETKLSSLDPALCTSGDDATIISQVFRGLYKTNNTGVIEADLANRYTLSEDGLTYTIELVSGVSWSDAKGFTESLVTAEDVVFSWKRAAALTLSSNSPYADMFSNIAGYSEALAEYKAANGEAAFDADKLQISVAVAEDTDDKKNSKEDITKYTFSVTLVEKDEYFLEKLTYPVFFPVKRAVVEANADWAINPETCIGNSVYSLKEIKKDTMIDFLGIQSDYIALVTNKKYDNYDIDSPIVTLFFMTNADRAAVIKKFEEDSISTKKKNTLIFVDGLTEGNVSDWESVVENAKKSSNEDAADIAKSYSKEMNELDSLSEYYLSFNSKVAPFNNPLVRKALTLAIDRAYICEVICTDNEIPAEGIISNGFSDINSTKTIRDLSGNYYNSERYDTYFEEAKACLAEAGYPNGEGFPDIRYLYNGEDATAVAVAGAIREMWTKLGIKSIFTEAATGSNYTNALSSDIYGVAGVTYDFDYNNAVNVLDMFTSDSENNYSNWSNEKYDKLVADIHEDLEIILTQKSGKSAEDMSNTKNDDIKDIIKAVNEAKTRISINVRDAEDLLFETDGWIVAPIYSNASLFLREGSLSNSYTSIFGITYFGSVDFDDE